MANSTGISNRQWNLDLENPSLRNTEYWLQSCYPCHASESLSFLQDCRRPSPSGFMNGVLGIVAVRVIESVLNFRDLDQHFHRLANIH